MDTGRADAAPSAAAGHGDALVVRLEGDMTVAHAQALRERLVEAAGAALAADAPLAIDLSGVEGFDSAGVQLLLAARATLRAGGRGMRVDAAPPPVRAALDVYGLAGALLDAADAAPALEDRPA